MSEFKFACPVCGQHITCDSGGSGSQMDCPTCFRKLVVPQAPAEGSKGFVLTAAEVQNRSAAAGSRTAASVPTVTKATPIFPIAIGMVLVALLAAGVVYYFTKQGFRNPGDAGNKEIRATNAVVLKAAPLLVLPPPAPDATNWTLNLTEAKIPDAPASGAVRGLGFKLDRASIQGGKLDLKQGTRWPPEVGVSLQLFADRSEDLAGKTVVLEAARTNSPRMILRWKDGQANASTKEYRKGYAARIEFGKVVGNRLEGRIYVAAPDDMKSYIAGTFSAEIRKPAPPK